MSAPAFTVRSPATAAETHAFFRLASQTFISEAVADAEATRWSEFVASAPDRAAYHLRGAYRGDQYLGGYVMHERTLCLGDARLRTGCIAAVVTHPDHRFQGVGAALMRDATALAQARECALLLLGGIPDFYHRFGYTDVLDITEHTVERDPILALPPSPCRVRPVTLADAPVFQALCRRHYGSYRGSFAWTPAQFEHKLRLRLPDEAPLLALDAAGHPCGYLIHPWSPEDTYTAELAADHWPALLALLQHQARQQAHPDAPKTLVWPLPPDTPTFYLLADHLPVRSETRHQPRAGWMARPAHLPALFQAMLPQWQACWQRARLGWTGTITLTVGEESCSLELSTAGVRFAAPSSAGGSEIRLTPDVFTQILFGFRPAWWAAGQPDRQVSEELLPVLEALFPQEAAWIAGTDAF